MRLFARLTASYIALLILLAVAVAVLFVWQVNLLAVRVRGIEAPGSPFDARKIAEHLHENGMTAPLPDRWTEPTLHAGGWVQVVDVSGREVAAVQAPADRPRAYTLPKLAVLNQATSGPWVYSVAAIGTDEEPSGVVILAAPSDARSTMRIELNPVFVGAVWDQFTRGLMWAGGAALALAFIVAMFLARRLVRPVVELARGLGLVTEGDLSKRIAVRGKDEIARLAAAYNQLLNRLQAAEGERKRIEVARKKLVANIAHDLRTPLTAIRGFAEGVVDEAIPSETRRRYAEIIAMRVKDLDDLLGDLLQLSELQAIPQAGRTPTDLGELVRERLIANLPEIERAGLELDVRIEDGLPQAAVDPKLVGRALQNLLNNALKHGNGAKSIVVSLRSAGGDIVLEVRDDGVGIRPEDLPHVFDRYYKGRSTHDGAQGEGLGLAIVKEIAEIHGGRVEVDAAPGRGSAFRFVLPASPSL